MTDSTLAAIYKGWETYHGLLIAALAPLSDDQLALKAGPGLRTIDIIALHIIATRAGWFHVVAGVGSAEKYLPLDDWDREGQPSRSAAELVSGLQSSWQLIQEALAKWTPADLSTPFTIKRGDKEHTFTRQWIIWHVIEHDLHHGGEISIVLGANGLNGVAI